MRHTATNASVQEARRGNGIWAVDGGAALEGEGAQVCGEGFDMSRIVCGRMDSLNMDRIE